MEITEGSPDVDRPLDTNLKDRDNKDQKKKKAEQTSETCGGNIKMSNMHNWSPRRKREAELNSVIRRNSDPEFPKVIQL